MPAPGSSGAARDTDNTQVNTYNENTSGEKCHEKLTRKTRKKRKRRGKVNVIRSQIELCKDGERVQRAEGPAEGKGGKEFEVFSEAARRRVELSEGHTQRDGRAWKHQ